MENASKALIIAGAILLVIAIIAIGIGIVNKTKGTINEVENQVSTIEIEMHNKIFEKYASNGNAYDKSYEEMRELVREIMSQNDKNKGNKEKVVYLTIYLFNGSSNQAYYYIDNWEHATIDEKKLYDNMGAYSWMKDVTIQKVYNFDSSKDRVINANEHSKKSMFNIVFQTDEKGYINFCKITKVHNGISWGGKSDFGL